MSFLSLDDPGKPGLTGEVPGSRLHKIAVDFGREQAQGGSA
jgi:hypothetical protein